MKQICTLLLVLFTSVSGYCQSITEVLLPQYISGDGTVSTTDDAKVPYACRLTLTGLTPNTTYRYYNRFVTASSSATSTGDGYYILAKPSGDFIRVTSPSLSAAGRYGELTTNAAGSYTGWFVGEASNTPSFGAGSTVFVRIILNNGAGGSAPSIRLTTASSVTVIGFGSTAAEGTALRSTPAAAGVAKNFVMLYDDAGATARPVAGTFIESDGTAGILANGYADFYANNVEVSDRAWGTIIPNNLVNGIRKISHFSLADATDLGTKTSADGTWAKDGGGSVSTVNTSGGLANVIVLNGNVVTLGASVQLPQTITFNAISAKTYGEANFDAGASASSLLPVTLTSSSPSVATITGGNTIHITGAGTTDIKAEQPGNADYQAAAAVMQTLIVNKASLTITADNKNMVQGDPLPAFTLSYTGFVQGEDAAVLTAQPVLSTTATVSSAPGQYPITASRATAANYEITYVEGILTITANKQQQSITFPALPVKTYGAADFSAGATASSGLTIIYTSSDPTVASIVNGQIRIVAAGAATITASQPGDANFEPAADMTQQLVINKTPLLIKADNKTKLVGQANPALTITYTGFVKNETSLDLTIPPQVSTTATDISPAGDYPITVSGAASGNYEITYEAGTLQINPLPAQTISFAALPLKRYGDAAIAPGAIASSGLPVTYTSSNTQVAIVSQGEIQIVGAGTAIITASQPGDAFNEPAPDIAQMLTVQKAFLSIKADDKVKTEGQPNPALTIVYNGFVKGENETALTTVPVAATVVTVATLPGVYPITVSGAASANYQFVQEGGSFMVTPFLGTGQNTMNAWCSAPGQLRVNVFADSTGKGLVQLFDPAGNRLLNAAITIGKGHNTWQFPVGNITKGIYYLRVTGTRFTLKEKVTIR